MLKLTKTQAKILADADACREDAIEAPEGAQRAVAPLVRDGLLAVMPDESGPTRLKITPQGRQVLAGRTKKRTATAAAEADHTVPPHVSETAKRPAQGKLETMVSLLQRPEGANLQLLVEATGWQPHSVRGALSGALKKGRGLPVTSAVADGVRIYRIAN